MTGFPSINGKSGFQKLPLWIILVVLVLCSLYLIVWDPIQDRAERIKGDVLQLRQDIQRYLSQKLERQRLQTRINKLKKSWYGEIQNIQQGNSPVGLRSRVTGIAHNHQLEITNWQPDAMVEESPDGIKKTLIRVQVKGGYHQVASFFAGLLRLPEVFGISQFTIGMKEDPSQDVDIQTNFVMTILPPDWLEKWSPQVNQFSKKNGQNSGI